MLSYHNLSKGMVLTILGNFSFPFNVNAAAKHFHYHSMTMKVFIPSFVPHRQYILNQHEQRSRYRHDRVGPPVEFTTTTPI